MTAEQKKGVRNLGLIGSSLGIGSAIGIAAASVLKTKPELFAGLLTSFGPIFVICMGVLYVVDRNAGKFIEVQRQQAVAQQQTADAIQAIAQKDDRQTERLALEIRYVGGQMETLLSVMDEIRRGQERSRGATA